LEQKSPPKSSSIESVFSAGVGIPKVADDRKRNMKLTPAVRRILDHYEGERPSVKINLARMLMHGHLSGTGKLMILAVDQGFEHGPRTFVMNPSAFDPLYHYEFAVKGGMSAYAAPLGWLSAGSESYLGAVPTILKLNSGNSLYDKSNPPDQAITASIDDALYLGCSAVGFTIYPGSGASCDQMEEIRELAHEARAHGLAVIVWSYPRGGELTKDGETALDVIAYGAHMACLLGAHIVKVKIPTNHLGMVSAKPLYEKFVDTKTPESCIRHIVESCFKGRRLVIFSGGETKNIAAVYEDARTVAKGGGHGVIIGRNCFQRPLEEGLSMLKGIEEILKVV
jgi:class I fructose-bisphosphate aldolase